MIMVLWKRLMALMIWMVVALLAKMKSYMWIISAINRFHKTIIIPTLPAK
jgi:hypothetical protein